MMDVLLSPDHVFDFPANKPEPEPKLVEVPVAMNGWIEEDDEWLMAPVMPPRATGSPLNTYKVGGPSTVAPNVTFLIFSLAFPPWRGVTFIPAMCAYSFTMHHLASCLPFILHASCMVSYKDDLYKLLLVQVMAAPTILVFAEENLRDSINIRMDIIHPEPVNVVAFPTAAVVDIAEAENASLRARIKTTEAIKKITRNRERQARIKIEQQLAAV
ncbi:hypothetical protein Tco_0545652 [Tanacetum coccineum]